MNLNTSQWISNSIWLFTAALFLVNTNAVLAFQGNQTLQVFSDSNVTGGGDFSFSSTNDIDLSGSPWGFGVDESSVYQAALKHEQTDGTSSDWEIRVGQGGQIYSIQNAELGEIVPPQSRSSHYVDEVFQSISVDTSPRTSGGEAAFYHQAGYYTDGNNITQPTYAPLLRSGSAEPNSYSTVSLAVQASTTATPQIAPGLLNYQRTKDLGDGVIEVTNGIYNFGSNTVDFHNLPWGGVRKTKLDHILVSDPGGGFTERDIVGFQNFEEQTEFADNTGGWAAFAQGTDGSSQGLAYVFGDTDEHLDEDWQTSRSSWRWGDGGGDFLGFPIRNFNVGTFRRQVDINTGEFFESRHFLVLGDVDHIESTIAERGLVAAATYDKVLIDQEDSSTLSYRIQSDGDGISVLETGVAQANFQTFAKPVSGSKPLFLLEDAEGRQYLSVDPYALSLTPYDSVTDYVGFLGFVLPEELTDSNGDYVALSTLFPESFYLASDSAGPVFALQGIVVAVPEPSAVIGMLLIFGLGAMRRSRHSRLSLRESSDASTDATFAERKATMV